MLIKTLEKVPSIHTFKKSIKEMTKCIVVCANCHRKIHAGTKIANKNRQPKKTYINYYLSYFQILKNKKRRPPPGSPATALAFSPRHERIQIAFANSRAVFEP